MFRGNTDGDTISRSEFEVPIIAQWIRINPTRWTDRISMRVELFGCEYGKIICFKNYNLIFMWKSTILASDDLSFNGTSMLKLNLLRDPISAAREIIRFRFKTSVANGILLYSRGSQGDYIALQLRENRLLLNIDLGNDKKNWIFLYFFFYSCQNNCILK